MPDKYVIGVDLGTESARVGLFSLSGELIETAAVAYPTTYPNVGWAEQNPVGAACRKVTSSFYSGRSGTSEKDIDGDGEKGTKGEENVKNGEIIVENLRGYYCLFCCHARF